MEDQDVSTRLGGGGAGQVWGKKSRFLGEKEDSDQRDKSEKKEEVGQVQSFRNYAKATTKYKGTCPGRSKVRKGGRERKGGNWGRTMSEGRGDKCCTGRMSVPEPGAVVKSVFSENTDIVAAHSHPSK